MTPGVDATAGSGDVHLDAPLMDPVCEVEQGCITCGDVAEEMRVVTIDADRELALCEHASGERQTVEIALVQPVSKSDTLLVHAGTALSKVDDQARTPSRGSRPNGPRPSRGQVVQAGAEHPPGSDYHRNTPGREAEELLR